MENVLLQTFGNEKRWVTWQYEIVINKKGKEEKTKVPYHPYGYKASSTNPQTWSFYKDIKQENIGIIFKQDKLLLGIDLDHVLVNKVIFHSDQEAIKKFIIDADTYTELSPSETGLHVYLKLSDPLILSANKSKNKSYECYTSGRFFTVTNRPFQEIKEVRTVTSKEAVSLLSILGYPWDSKTQTDEDILNKMFVSQYGNNIKALYNGDISYYNNDDSAADMALCNHFASWTEGNASLIESLWLKSPLGQREKTQHRKDYRDRTIKAALEKYRLSVSSNLLFIIKNNIRVPVLNTENLCRVLRSNEQFSKRFRYDSFKNTYEIKDIQRGWREFEMIDAIIIQTELSVLYPFCLKAGKDMVYDAIMKIMKENEIDSASEYLKNLVWDKTPRLDSWLIAAYGTPQDAYHVAVGSNWIKGLVKRIIEPGCKFDYVLLLKGDQGVKKSMSLSALGGSWHVETTMNTDTKDFFMQFFGKAIIEFSEGEVMRITDIKRLKAIISMQADKYRPPYERTSREFPRRCVFAMTTNEDQPLRDNTGNRRWFPVQVQFPEADTQWLCANRDQLFAEAYYRVIELKQAVHEFPKEETLAIQEANRANDPNEDIIVYWYYNTISQDARNEGITIQQIYKEVLNEKSFAVKPLDKYIEMQIASILKNSLKLSKRRTMKDGDYFMRWFDDNNLSEKFAPKQLTQVDWVGI